MSSTSSPTLTNSNPIGDKIGQISIDNKRLYLLWFRRGNRKPESVVFEFKGDLPAAIKRSQLHCTKMDFRFCGCYPFVVNLDIVEKYREDNIELESTF